MNLGTIVSEKTKEKMRMRWAEGKYDNRKTYKKFISSWEDKFYELLTNHYEPKFKIERQYRMRGLRHQFDLAIPFLKILIEIDGNYYHSLPGVPERDAQINEFVWRTYPDWTLYRYSDEHMKTLGVGVLWK